MTYYTNSYRCHACACTWQIEADSQHDDRCPECNATNEPFNSVEETPETVELNGKVYPLDVVANLMDDQLREQLHAFAYPDEQAFVDAYCHAHEKKHGTVFTV
jgi:hypothetical protein